MAGEFMHRGIRFTVNQFDERQLAWTIFPAPRAEITGVVSNRASVPVVRAAVSEARAEIDAWLLMLTAYPPAGVE